MSISATRAPLLGSKVTKPSEAKRIRASLTGVRETLKRLSKVGSSIFSPGGNRN